MATHKQIIWSVIVLTSWLSFMAGLWLAEFNHVDYWFVTYWAITFIIVLPFGIEKK